MQLNQLFRSIRQSKFESKPIDACEYPIYQIMKRIGYNLFTWLHREKNWPGTPENPADIPVILCTGFSEQITEGRAKELGIKEFILKPIVLNKLAAIVRSVLDGG